MKSFEILLAAIIVACIGLSFTSKNNFDTEAHQQTKAVANNSAPITVAHQQNQDTIALDSLMKYVNNELIEPIRNCFMEKDPHMFMTKCYTRISFELNESHRNRRLYKDDNIEGSLVLIDCSVESYMATIRVNYAQKSITLKESFTSPRKEKDKYLNDLCKHVKKNGIPRDF
ncbi:MAG: hypothetical protein GY810_00035 [Aureispira sp.]|nr:hypothetical protein [Aureispira sp.]